MNDDAVLFLITHWVIPRGICARKKLLTHSGCVTVIAVDGKKTVMVGGRWEVGGRVRGEGVYTPGV